MSAAIYFHPEAYTTSGPRLMGRNAAGESFLRGFLTHASGTAFHALVDQPAHGTAFAQAVQQAGRTGPVSLLGKADTAALARAGTLYLPGPGLAEHAWRRAAFGHGQWSLCGITHTTASARAMDTIVDMLTAPVQPWDALVCTSNAVRDNVGRLLQAQGEHLKHRLGATRLVLPELPVIPLGLHTEDFVFSPAQRDAARRALGATSDTLVVLFVGRLSFHAKAHPLAMYQALEQAAAGRDVLLVECGWHANEHIAKAFADAARLACPSVRVAILDGRLADARTTAWAGADVFCSLSDNVQETFGIVPIEAMAAGLPVVVSDWDGYKDTVRDGVDGFRIPTTMPAAGAGAELALAHALEVDSYDHYCGHTCMAVAVDVLAAAQAFERLFASPELRARMGESGRRRARAVYDWQQVIGQYEALWAHLATVRQNESRGLAAPIHPWPARMEPFEAFAAYPTWALQPDTRLALSGSDAAERLARWRSLEMVRFATPRLPDAATLNACLSALDGGPMDVAELTQRLQPGNPARMARGLSYLLKLGLLQRV